MRLARSRAAGIIVPVAASGDHSFDLGPLVAEIGPEALAVQLLDRNASAGAQGTVEQASDEEWHRVLDVNVVGTARVSRAAWPALRASAHAAVVNTCSIAATAGLPQRAVYSASKDAVAALTSAMAADGMAGLRLGPRT